MLTLGKPKYICRLDVDEEAEGVRAEGTRQRTGQEAGRRAKDPKHRTKKGLAFGSSEIRKDRLG